MEVKKDINSREYPLSLLKKVENTYAKKLLFKKIFLKTLTKGETELNQSLIFF